MYDDDDDHDDVDDGDDDVMLMLMSWQLVTLMSPFAAIFSIPS